MNRLLRPRPSRASSPGTLRRRVDSVFPRELPRFSAPRLRGEQRRLGHYLDLSIAGVVALAVLPLMIAICLCIKLDSAGPVIYPRQRMARGGRPFNCLKFRSMYQDADDRLKGLLDAD